MRVSIVLLILAGISISFAQIDVGQPAPTFYLPIRDGGSFYMSRMVGADARTDSRAPIVLCFFQAACDPCQTEIEELVKLQSEFPDIGIYLVNIRDSDEVLAEFVQAYETIPEILLDRYAVNSKRYGAVLDDDTVVLPNTYFITMDATIHYHHTDFSAGDETIYREKLVELTAMLEEERAALAAAAAAEEEQAAAAAEEEAHPGLEAGQPAPTFSLPRLEGQRFYLSQVVGEKVQPENRKPVVVSFFQTTCIPCKAEIAELTKLQDEFPDVVIYLVDLNETEELVAEYIETFDLKLEMLMDRYGAVGKMYEVVDPYGLAVLPNSFIVAPDGTLYYHHVGFKPGDEEIYREKFIELTSQ